MAMRIKPNKDTTNGRGGHTGLLDTNVKMPAGESNIWPIMTVKVLECDKCKVRSRISLQGPYLIRQVIASNNMTPKPHQEPQPNESNQS